MQDIQSQADDRRVDIRKVGVREIRYPVTVLDRARREQRTIAAVNMFVNLPHHFKGTHMSRFVEILNRHRDRIGVNQVHRILEEMKERLDAEEAHLEMSFPFFVKRARPAAARVELDRYRCTLHGSLAAGGHDLVLGVRIPIRLTPPAPRAGHLPRSRGRWGEAVVRVRFRRFAWIEEIINLAEEAIMGHNPPGGEEDGGPTVEAMARAVGRALAGFAPVKWFSVKVRNLSEGYSTFAAIEGGGS